MILLSTFEQCWSVHPNKEFTATIDQDKLQEIVRVAKEEDLLDCPNCTFVGYILLRCELHHARAWAKTLL